jgi:hypothetical protein
MVGTSPTMTMKRRETPHPNLSRKGRGDRLRLFRMPRIPGRGVLRAEPIELGPVGDAGGPRA